MAAKPPKPPGNFLKTLLHQHINNKNQQQQDINEVNDIEDNNSEQLLTGATTTTCAAKVINSLNSNTTPPIAATKKTNCNCSNISIMHLFHEMKQEFPTLPDTIVAQCVNENCHQRENCIQMLRNELELNPIPAQSYPAKVLHPPTNNIHNNTTTTSTPTTTPINSLQKPPLQQKPTVLQQKPPFKPIKPIRTAPLQPPSTVQQCNNNNNNNSITKTNSPISKNITATKQLSDDDLANKNNGVGVGRLLESNTPQHKQSISTTTKATATPTEVNNNDNICGSVGGESVERNLPRQRPTTLNLNTQLQQQQRQRLNVQLQQRFQEQQNRQQKIHQQPQNNNNNNINVTKPIRKAPLPPIAPKPSQFQTNLTNKSVNSILNDSQLTTSPLSESEISVSVSLSTPSPTSPNSATHHSFNNTPTTNTTKNSHQTHLPTKSPIRHRSVINLQPEPPYTRDFLFTPTPLLSSTPTSPSLAAPPTEVGTTAIQTTATNSSSSATSSPTASVAGSQKSFTSVNLTLRPPVSPTGQNSALQPSTIDITAGPGFSGASGGGKSLHYSSTSYDARLGYQQNFQITVTDEGGVFSACRVRPQQQQNQRCLNQQQQNLQLQQQQQQQQQFHNNNVVALQQNIQNSIISPHGIGGVNTSSGFGGSGTLYGGNCSGLTTMCLPNQHQAMDDTTQEILQRQKKKRDKLAASLREYKKRLGNVEQEINLLTGTIPSEGLSERLDEEITKLRRDCQDMVRSSSTFAQPQLQQELAIDHQPLLQQPTQPFPRQRIQPPPRPPPPRQTSLDIIQHHSQPSTPHTSSAASLPNLNLHNSPQQQQYSSLNSITSPAYLHQQSSPLPVLRNTSINSNSNVMHSNSHLNEEPLVDDVDDYEYEEVVEPWECNMCTFENHPQLNICEACDNVRIIPGRIKLPRTMSATNCTNLTNAAAGNLDSLNSSRSGLNTVNENLEHDTNLVQQQLQHCALHT